MNANDYFDCWRQPPEGEFVPNVPNTGNNTYAIWEQKNNSDNNGLEDLFPMFPMFPGKNSISCNASRNSVSSFDAFAQEGEQACSHVPNNNEKYRASFTNSNIFDGFLKRKKQDSDDAMQLSVFLVGNTGNIGNNEQIQQDEHCDGLGTAWEHWEQNPAPSRQVISPITSVCEPIGNGESIPMAECQNGDVSAKREFFLSGRVLPEPKSASEFYAAYGFWPWQTPWLDAHPGRKGLAPEIRDGMFWHWCPGCGRWGCFGYGFDQRRGLLGQWYCDQHRPGMKGGE